MQNLEFNTGMIELAIQGDPDRVLRFNPTDSDIAAGFMRLLEKSNEKLIEAAEKEKQICSPENKLSGIEKVRQKSELNSEADRFLRDELDQLFGPGTSEMVFGKMCVTATTENGEPVFMGFMRALLGEIESENRIRNQKTEEVVERYKPQRE